MRFLDRLQLLRNKFEGDIQDSCPFCDFLRDNFEELEEEDEKYVRAHLILHHGISR